MSDEAARRRQLIEATIETLAEVGFNAASLSEIARRANVSTGLFAHYFGDKDGLLEATLRFVAARLARSAASGLRAAATRRERLFAVCEAALADEEFDRRTGAVWLTFWGQMAHSDRYQRIQGIYERRMLSNLRHALHGLVPEDRVGLCAVLIAAGIDGLWLRSHTAKPSDREIITDGASARSLVRALVEGLLASPALVASARSRVSNSLPLSQPHSAGRLPSKRDTSAFAISPRGAVPAARVAGEAQRGLADWETYSAPDRARILRRCADALRNEKQTLARIESRETGRPIRSTAADISEAIVGFEEAARLALGMRKVRVELDDGRIEERRHERGRLVAGEIHWSRPVLEFSAFARAIGRGDALLLRADPHGARTAAKVAHVLVSAGLPEGVLTLPTEEEAQLLLEDQFACGGAETAHTRADKDDDWVRFGRAGPKAATIILPGGDLEKASRSVLLGSRAWTGSSFGSQSRIFVHQSVRGRFAEACGAAAAALRLGDPLEEETEVGPLLSREHGEWIEELLSTDLRAGATLISGGKTMFGLPSKPVFLAPTVIDGCSPTSALVRAETFAAVVALESFDNDDDVAIELSRNNLAEALGVFAGDPERARRLVDACDRPLSFVNDDGLGESERAWWRQGSIGADTPPLRRTIIAKLPGAS
jgi:betaine-aldehyde dehydrogenase